MSLRILLSNIKYLMSNRVGVEFEELNFRLKDEILDDMVYEYEENKQKLRTLNILDEEETVELLMKFPKSFSRFGDGEINLMKGQDQPFQKYDKRLVEKMYRILEQPQPDMYIGLNKKYFKSVFGLRNHGKYFRLYGTEFRRFFLRHCNEQNIYVDASFTGGYFENTDNYDFELHYDRMKNMFKGKKIVVVSGEGVLEKLQYDVFCLAAEKRIIHGPAKHAFECYDELFREICQNVDKDELLCFVLGMAGKAMIRDLTDEGYMAWDIGHMAKDYDYYMRRVEKTEENSAEFYAPD